MNATACMRAWVAEKSTISSRAVCVACTDSIRSNDAETL